MRFLTCVNLAVATFILVVAEQAPGSSLRLLEFAPGVTQVLTEDEKWTLKAKGQSFFDITEHAHVPHGPFEKRQQQPVKYPTTIQYNNTVRRLVKRFDKTEFITFLQSFTTFHNRHCTSDYGKNTSIWLQAQLQAMISRSEAKTATVKSFQHPFAQSSVIVTVPGKSEKTIVLGAHLDCQDRTDRAAGRAPGADDNGSGVVTLFESLRVLLSDPVVAAGKALNTIEFHFYAGEEGGLLGSQDIYYHYSQSGRDVKGFLQHDVGGYTAAAKKAGEREAIAIAMDYADACLIKFLKMIITAYCTLPYVESKCGYACSDHASATRFGYPAVLTFESEFSYVSPHIHTPNDTVDTLDLDHIVQNAWMSIGFVYELAMANLL
ncbi:leucine aminopeptidase A [Aspergillus avenaceus]|uniref:Peptide hydrolase n=1 Tax=Aspergillus avenaceus TaxID=36643 RepID=A0A5N6U012_ASPAV|nr:leucine aminopeptidase A [Aspergillus avenaceus]